jgi:hypothetical protein
VLLERMEREVGRVGLCCVYELEPRLILCERVSERVYVKPILVTKTSVARQQPRNCHRYTLSLRIVHVHVPKDHTCILQTESPIHYYQP